MAAKHTFHLIITSVLAVFCICPIASALTGWQVLKLTDNTVDDKYAKAGDSKVVWITRDENDTEIMLYDGSSTIQLTNNAYDESDVQISGSNVVWVGHDGQDYEIFYYNGSTTTQLTNNAYNDMNPSICGNHIAWQAAVTGAGAQIFYYDGATTSQITNHPLMGSINPVVDGNDIYWVAYNTQLPSYSREYNIFRYDGSFDVIYESSKHISNLDAENGCVVWCERNAYYAKSMVYRYDGSEVEELGSRTIDDTFPDLSHCGRTVWQVTDRDGNGDIYCMPALMYPPRKFCISRRATGDNIYPAAWGNRAAWVCRKDTYDEVWLYDGGTCFELTTVGSASILPPDVSENTVVWTQRDADDFEVWMAFPRPIYVDDSAPGSQNGSSWYHAYTKLQDALAAASSGDEIRVAQGVYYPDEGVGQTNNDKSSTFTMKLGVSLKGGYAGYGADNPNARDPQNYPSVLSGDLQQNDGTITDPDELFTAAWRSDNAENIVMALQMDETASIDGFTISGGRGGTECGGGLLYSPPAGEGMTVANCVFEYNQGLFGGAIWTARGTGGAKMTVRECTFRDNLAFDGGALCAWCGVEMTIEDCNFTRNCSQYNDSFSRRGGALWLLGPATIQNCHFQDNRSVNEGGAIYQDDPGDTSYISDCTFIHNQGGGLLGGGAICYAGLGAGDIVKCSFARNSSTTIAGALAIYNSAKPHVTNCEFLGNYAADRGGAMWNGHDCDSKIFGSLFVGNTAQVSGGVVLCTNYNSSQKGNPRFINCTFVENSAPAGSLIACEKDTPSSYGPSYVTFTNSIISQSAPLVYIDDSSTVKIGLSDVVGGYTGYGNFNADPCFVALPADGGDGFGDNPATGPDESANDDYGNLRLLPTSPCIDRGTNGYVHYDYADIDGDGYTAECVPLDLDGFARFTDDPAVLDLGAPLAGYYPYVIDLGVYERGVCGDDGHPYPTGDANYDCFVDLNDFAAVANNWLSCTGPDCY